MLLIFCGHHEFLKVGAIYLCTCMLPSRIPTTRLQNVMFHRFTRFIGFQHSAIPRSSCSCDAHERHRRHICCGQHHRQSDQQHSGQQNVAKGIQKWQDQQGWHGQHHLTKSNKLHKLSTKTKKLRFKTSHHLHISTKSSSCA